LELLDDVGAFLVLSMKYLVLRFLEGSSEPESELAVRLTAVFSGRGVADVVLRPPIKRPRLVLSGRSSSSESELTDVLLWKTKH
jgi:hypothetical protein